MSPQKPQGLIDRVIKTRHCPSGRIEDLRPDAFARKQGEKDLSFYDRDQQSPKDTLAAYNATPGWPKDKQGKWTAAIHAGQAEKIICVADVILDDPENDPAHVAVILDPEREPSDEKMMRERMVELAQEHGLFL